MRLPSTARRLSATARPWLVAILGLILVRTPAYSMDDADYRGSCIQAGCHAGLTFGKSVHQPVTEEMCDICHEEESPHTFLPTPACDELCPTCHESSEGMSKHSPYEEASCDACHKPHHSENPTLLISKVPDLCRECHDKQERDEERQHVKCTNCHLPHTSSRSSLKKDDVPALCMKCHSRLVRFEERMIPGFRNLFGKSKVVHPPAQDECTICHDPHALDRRALLAGAFPEGPYASFSADKYEICFQCHEPEMIDPLSADTQFRKGKTNLHALHVGGKKGRNCIICHDPHAAGASLIRKDAAFGDWRLPIRFEPDEGGGRCSPGCHETRNYSRD